MFLLCLFTITHTFHHDPAPLVSDSIQFKAKNVFNGGSEIILKDKLLSPNVPDSDPGQEINSSEWREK